MKRDGYHLDVEQCLQCGDGYYPPQKGPRSTNGLGKCKQGYYLPMCKPCKVKRKEINYKRKYDDWQARVRLKLPAKKKEVILDMLRKGPTSVKDLLYNPNTIRSRIACLRKSGYDIRSEKRYILVREPKDRI